MHRKFIAIILSAAIAATSLTSQPAHAGNDDVGKWIAGLATLAIIGVAINEHKKDKRKKRHDRHVSRVPDRNPYVLPRQCRVTRNLQGHEIRGFRKGCLKRNAINVDALPRDCAVRFRDQARDRRVTLYTGRCLRQHGYRVSKY